jgi:LmbE family N-acetylglucosaminyl deacetylase
VAELVHRAPASALAIYAHPNDPEVSCGGTLARWARAGCRVEVLLATTGDKGSSDQAMANDELVERRRGESERAGEVIGVAAHHWLGHPDGELFDERALIAAIVGVLRAVRPEVVVCPDPTAVFFGEHYFNHRDHRAVGWAALDAVSPAASQPRYFPEHGAAHQVSAAYLSATVNPDVWVDISASLDDKAAALMCHQSQLEEPGEWLRTVVSERAEEAGRQAGVRFAEGFRRLRLAG